MTNQVQPQTFNDAVEALNKFNEVVTSKNSGMKLDNLSATFADSFENSTTITITQNGVGFSFSKKDSDDSLEFGNDIAYTAAVDAFSDEYEIFYQEGSEDDQPPF